MFATNFFGPVDLIKAVLPHMRQRRSGTIANVSSIGAPRSNPGSGYYTATKAALEGMFQVAVRGLCPSRGLAPSGTAETALSTSGPDVGAG